MKKDYHLISSSRSVFYVISIPKELYSMQTVLKFFDEDDIDKVRRQKTVLNEKEDPVEEEIN